MSKLSRWTLVAAAAGLATAAPAHATSFLQELGSPFATGDAPYGVVTADFNRDGRLDLATINGTGSNMTVLLRQPAGSFRAETGSPFGVVGGPGFGSVADFDRDGLPDIAVAGYTGNAVSVLRRLPTGGFANFPGTPFAANNAGSVVAGDFNADGRMDVAAGRWDNNTIAVMIQQANGTFAAESSPATAGNPRFLASADFNHDGRADLAVSNINTGNVSIFLRNAGNTGFVQEAGSPITVGSKPVGVVATDLNADGYADLAVANSGSGTVTILNRLPTGGFAPAGAPLAAGDQPLGIAVADFSHDGLLDLAVANATGARPLTLFDRQANGTYVEDAASPITLVSRANQVAAGDFNGDGKPDLAATTDLTDTVTVLLNTTPDPVTPTPTPPAPVQTPAPAAPAPAAQTPPLAPRISGRLVLAWTIFKNYVRLDGATLKDVPAGSTVRIGCSTCKKKSVTLTAKKSTVQLSQLRNAKLKRGKSFSLTITRPGYVGQVLSRKVKHYGKTLKAMKKALKAPFTESRACVPVNATKPAKSC